MYIGHLFDPLHCKFATFMANDSAHSAIFYWLALYGLWEMQACGLHGGRFLPDFRCGRMDAGRPRVVWAAVTDWKMHCGALPDAARCVLVASHVWDGRKLACVTAGWGLGGFHGLVERARERGSWGIRATLSFW